MAMATAASAHISHFIPCPLSLALRRCTALVLYDDLTGG
jgi:hypothetical protein